jgi:hypothetical protein
VGLLSNFITAGIKLEATEGSSIILGFSFSVEDALLLIFRLATDFYS